jgi:hypothetical protein
VKGEGIDRSEMTFDTSNFIFKDPMEKLGLEFTSTCRSSGDITRFLTTTDNNLGRRQEY